MAGGPIRTRAEAPKLKHREHVERHQEYIRLSKFLQEKHPANVLMEFDRAGVKPLHSFKPAGTYTWEKARFDFDDKQLGPHSNSANVVAVMVDDLVVIDFDTRGQFMDAMVAAYPVLQTCPAEDTSRGAHFYMMRTPFCDERGLFLSHLSDSTGAKLEVDVITRARSGTPSAVKIAPSVGKEWVARRSIYDIEIPPIPDDLVLHLLSFTAEGRRNLPSRTTTAAAVPRPPRPAQPVAQLTSAEVSKKVAMLERVLPLLDPVSRLTPRDKWLKVGMALFATFGGHPEGLRLWQDASARAPNYDESSVAQQWEALRSYPITVSEATIHKWATEDGGKEAWWAAKREPEDPVDFVYDEPTGDQEGGGDGGDGGEDRAAGPGDDEDPFEGASKTEFDYPWLANLLMQNNWDDIRDRVFAYLNTWFVAVLRTGKKKMEIFEVARTSRGRIRRAFGRELGPLIEQYAACTVSDWDGEGGSKKRGPSVFQLWNEWVGRATKKGITWEPIEAEARSDMLNVYPGLRVEVEHDIDALEIDMSLVQPFLDHLHEVLCGGAREMSTYVLKWLAHIFQRFGEKIMTAIVFISKQGIGKSTLFEDMIGKRIIGDDLWSQMGESEGGVHGAFLLNEKGGCIARFNKELRDRLLIMADEPGMRDSFWKLQNDLKGLITRTTLMVEEKGRDKYLRRDRANWVFCTNEDEPVKIEVSDRRFVVPEPGDPRPREYYDHLYQLMDRAAPHLYKFLLTVVDISGWDPKVIPFSRKRQEMKMSNFPREVRFLQYLAEHSYAHLLNGPFFCTRVVKEGESPLSLEVAESAFTEEGRRWLPGESGTGISVSLSNGTVYCMSEDKFGEFTRSLENRSVLYESSALVDAWKKYMEVELMKIVDTKDQGISKSLYAAIRRHLPSAISSPWDKPKWVSSKMCRFVLIVSPTELRRQLVAMGAWDDHGTPLRLSPPQQSDMEVDEQEQCDFVMD